MLELDDLDERDASIPADVVIAGSDHQTHIALGRYLHLYLRWRNANARHPDVLAAQRRERARGERRHRWGHPAVKAA